MSINDQNDTFDLDAPEICHRRLGVSALFSRLEDITAFDDGGENKTQEEPRVLRQLINMETWTPVADYLLEQDVHVYLVLYDREAEETAIARDKTHAQDICAEVLASEEDEEKKAKLEAEL